MSPGTRSVTQIGSLCMGMVSGRHALTWPAPAGGPEAWQRRLSRLRRACRTRHGGQRTRGGEPHPTAPLLVGTGRTRVQPCDDRWRTPSRIPPRDRDQTAARRDLSRLNRDGRILGRPQLPRPHMKKEHDRAHSAWVLEVVRPSAIPRWGARRLPRGQAARLRGVAGRVGWPCMSGRCGRAPG
jgi:hypothetical protein